MGWNSFDCYDMDVTEEEVLGNAEYMARHLHRYGYEYVVIDGMWYDPTSAAWGRSDVPLVIDETGRYQPCPVKFPSSAGGAGFKPIADQVHALGLKFGIHIMRGISREAVRQNLPILGTQRRAGDVGDTKSICSWWERSYGIAAAKEGAQEWYDSNVRMYAEWGVDFIKADDLSAPYGRGEIELIRNAIDRCGRDMVLSLSPGETPIAAAEHVKTHANMWRVSGDFWDEWPQLLKMFDLLEKWQPHIGPGHWPDADMLPLGLISIRRNPPKMPRITRFTPEEQRALMTLWCIARSPLMFGGDMRVLDPWTLSLITNEDVLAMHRASTGNRVLFHNDYRVAWTAKAAGGAGEAPAGATGGVADAIRRAAGATYLALFNTSNFDEVQISAALSDLGIASPVRVRELWTREDLGIVADRVQAVVPPHGAKLFLLTE
jgi:hypothetical protein